MGHIRTLRISAKFLSVFWGSLGVFWACRFVALWPDDLAYRMLPVTVACFAAATVLLGASRFLPSPAARSRRGRGWTARFLTWADEL